MAEPSIQDVNIYKGKSLTDKDWLHNLKQIIAWLTSGLYSVAFNKVSATTVDVTDTLTVNGIVVDPTGGGGGGGGGGSGSGSGLDQCRQNIVNGQAGIGKVPMVNGFDDDFMSDADNVIFSLGVNYSQGSPTISLTFVQPATLGDFRQMHMYPFRTQIYDSTNKSYMVLTGDNNAVDSATTVTFNIASPLVNMNGTQVAYNTTDTVSMLKMLSAGNGTGSVPSTLAGQAAAYPENLNIKYLPQTKNDATLETAVNYNPTKQYQVVSVPDVHTIVVRSDTNDSLMFPVTDLKGNPTQIIAYNTVDNQKLALTLSAPAIYDGTSQLTFSVNESNAGIETSTWWIIKPPIMSGIVEDAANAGVPSALQLGAIMTSLSDRYVHGIDFSAFPDTNPGIPGFNFLLKSYSGNTYNTSQIQIRNTTVSPYPGYVNRGISLYNGTNWLTTTSSLVFKNINNDSVSLTRYQEIEISGSFHINTLTSFPMLIAFIIGADANWDMGNGNQSNWTTFGLGNGLLFSNNNANSDSTSGSWVRAINKSDTYPWVDMANTGVDFRNTNTPVKFRALLTSTEIKIKYWYFGLAEPTNWNTIIPWISQSSDGRYLTIFCKSRSGISSQGNFTSLTCPELTVRYGKYMSIKYFLSEQSGNKITTATILPVNNSVMESSAIGGVAGYLG